MGEEGVWGVAREVGDEAVGAVGKTGVMSRHREYEDESFDAAEPEPEPERFGVAYTTDDGSEQEAERFDRRTGLRYLAALLLFLAALVTLLNVDAGDDKTVDRFLAVILVGALVAAITSLRR